MNPLLHPHQPGQSIGRYKLLEKLGEGGMGEVFLAEDSKLERRVALKILKASYGRDWMRLQRFKREAKAVAALSHPGIVTLYSDESVDDVHFLTMEHVPGVGLNEKIPKKGLPLDRLFEIGVQLTDAVSAAHAEGITHRDLKPSNIMLHEEGGLRILDFGLAKLKEQSPEEIDSDASTELMTRDGDLLGTVPYMAPEQVQGRPVDERTDIFACGVILYEMATGRRPFDGETPADLMSSIIRDEPPSIENRRHGMPHHLWRIIKRALEKDPERRYQSAKDLRNSLDDLRLELVSGDDAPAGRLSGRPRLLRLVVGLAALAVTLIGVLSWILTRETPPPALPQSRSFQVTSAPGWESDVAISPDGTLLAYASNESGNSDIWLVDALGGTPIQLTHDVAADSQPAWFPDGSAIAFASDRGGSTSIWKVPRLGGPQTMLQADAWDPAVSPDGEEIAFTRSSGDGDSVIAVARIGRPGEARELTDVEDGLWGHRQPAWSPDGRWICYADYGDLWLVPAGGGEASKLTTAGGSDRYPVWSPDGRFIYFSSYREETLAIWRVRVATGQTERLTPGTGPESQPTISVDGSRLGYTTFTEDPDIVLRDLRTDEEARIPGTRSEWGATLAPDNSAMVYVSMSILWRRRLDGIQARGEAARLHDEDAGSSNPAFSPDGSLIAYQRQDGDHRNIWVVPAAGGVPEPVTIGDGVRIHPAWSPDGSRIAYVSEGGEEPAGLWAANFNPGQPASESHQIETGPHTVLWPAWSPDGTEIAYVGPADGDWDAWIATVDNSRPPRRLTRGARADSLRWESGSNQILMSGRWDDGVLALRWVDAETGQSVPFEPTVDFGAAVFSEFEVSADGSILVFTRETVRGDLWLLEAQSGSY